MNDANEPQFRVTMTARLKHGTILEAIRSRKWTYEKTANFLGVSKGLVCEMVNLRWIPRTQRELPTKLEKKLIELTGQTTEQLWPEFTRIKEFREMSKTLEATREVTPAFLVAKGLLSLPPGPDELIERRELRELLEKKIGRLPPELAQVLRSAFFEDKTQQQIAHEIGCLPQTVSQRIQSGLKKLRHPSLNRDLRQFVK